MSDEKPFENIPGVTYPTEATQTALAPIPAPALELTATTPAEMQQAQTSLIAWCDQKILQMEHDAKELQENYEIALKNKWRTATLKRHADIAVKRILYYQKIKGALEAGYCIVPHFPVTLFAIRTDKDTPNRKLYIGTTDKTWGFEQDAKILPVGEGEYKSPGPQVVGNEFQCTDSKGNEITKHKNWADEWKEVDFPINMAKPRIMEATSRAMALHIFDEMGVLPDPYPKKDPLIVGRIIDPQGPKWARKRITFIVAWHLNVRDI